MMSRRRIPGKLWMLTLCLLLTLSACGPHPKDDVQIVVASSDTLEQQVVGKMTVLALQEAGYDVVDRSGMGSPWMVRAALEAGNVDVCWDYTGDAWTVHLGHDYPISDAGELFAKVRDEDILNEITWLSPCDWQHRMSLVVQRSFAEEHGLATLGDLAHHVNDVDPDVTLCAPRELYDTAHGVRGMERVYGFRFKEQKVRFFPMREGYEALTKGECDCALGLSVDATLMREDLYLLEDDRKFFQASNLAPVARTSVLRKAPGVEPVLVDLSAALTEDMMREIHQRAVIEEQDPAAVARRMLREYGM
ncbi:MAG: glycine betaine ABC transporter substrate-binding protein [Anaerolineae bacterium]